MKVGPKQIKPLREQFQILKINLLVFLSLHLSTVCINSSVIIGESVLIMSVHQ